MESDTIFVVIEMWGKNLHERSQQQQESQKTTVKIASTRLSM